MQLKVLFEMEFNRHRAVNGVKASADKSPLLAHATAAGGIWGTSFAYREIVLLEFKCAMFLA